MLPRFNPCLWWITALVILLLGLGRPPVTRSQEARVMLSAQEMAGQPPAAWLVPHLNGQPRFQKPPLATWLSAAMFSAMGVTDFAGRLPNAVAGWLTLAIVFRWARAIAGTRAGLMAAGGLLGSLFFFRFSRLAETDASAMPWITLSFYAIWQATRRAEGHTAELRRSDTFYFHFAAVGAALATMAKGGPGAFAAVFLVAMAMSNRSSLPITRFLRSGAWITYAAIALPWFVQAWLNPEARRVMAYETSLLLRGGGHGEPFYDYLLWIAYGCLPWTLFGIAAIARAGASCRRDGTSRDLLIAAASVLVPLCLIGQKQPHYLMSLMPILFVLTAVEIERMLAGGDAQRTVVRLLALTLGGAFLAAVGIGVLAAVDQTRASATSFLLAASLVGTAAIAAILIKRRGAWPALAWLGVCVPVVLVIALSLFWPAQARKPDPRVLAELLRQQVGNSPAAWWGENDSLAVTYYLRRIMPSYDEDPITPFPPPPRDVLLVDYDPVEEQIPTPTGYSQAYANDIDGNRLLVFVPQARVDASGDEHRVSAPYTPQAVRVHR